MRIGFELLEAGSRRIQFSIPPQPGERVDRNNRRNAWVDVRGESEKILYFEGEPRFEVKFLRRAVEDDENLQVVVLQRTDERLDRDGRLVRAAFRCFSEWRRLRDQRRTGRRQAGGH